ncbi:hypothetical protein [Reichenbachiella sp.]|uniref:hypothetical protein n=1 Tax=Reichenbachiella sp. TaxID=2184521 RepID=UPI003BB19DCE
MQLLLFLGFLSTDSIIQTHVVHEFHLLETREEELAFIDKYQDDSDPTKLGYVCAVEMKQAEYGINPIFKYKTFVTVKQKLDELIEANPTNVHLRYVRLLLQESTPKILGYNENIEEDKCILTEILEVNDESDLLDDYIYKNTSL